jgi:protein-S-isoprenylcysteine O-methyltransferase Ste14
VARACGWIGGALFAIALVWCAWFYLVQLGRPLPAGGARAIAFDAALLALFGVHHSLFAREQLKRAMAPLSPQAIRSLYVYVASLLLIAVCVLWQPIGGEIYDDAGVLAFAHAAVQIAGLWLIVRAVARIDPLELAGIHPPRTDDALQTAGPYRWVRHPLYLGWVVMVFGAAHMTRDRLAFAALTTIYLAVAVPWEERSLERTFGDAYVRYRRVVRWRIVPFIY